eukprot:CAMPEP_0172901182 /NCGR_PEP_ID=MMETSP1075-20121228/165737_1 /TAXON_ID=2916 /ORGANISM="Ceratium fusus, Strain PA161109" /LENGTH=36 /DNA_ID= /DNA_START= /DNA_END= /DNA_ORIENTATION=
MPPVDAGKWRPRAAGSQRSSPIARWADEEEQRAVAI